MKKTKAILAAGSASLALAWMPAPASAGGSDYLGEIQRVGFTFCPRGTAEAAGQLLAISTNQALFALYGTTYGGDGRTTFALPDLRGRAPINWGQGPGLSNYILGQRSGQESVTLTVSNLPSHNHTAAVQTANANANTGDPRGAAFGKESNGYVSGTAPSGRFMDINTVITQANGGGQSHDTRQPYLVMRYCVVTSGIFPSRN